MILVLEMDVFLRNTFNYELEQAMLDSVICVWSQRTRHLCPGHYFVT